MGARLVALVLCLALLAGSCARFRAVHDCRNIEWRAPRGVSELANVYAAKAYRNYIAVIGVEPAAHHFMVWYEDGSPLTLRLGVERDPAGRPDIILESWRTGTNPAAPPPVPSISPEVATLMQEVEGAILSRCQTAPDLKIQYTGLYRTVTVRELISLKTDDNGIWGFGWVATAKVAMDERLTRILGDVELEDQLGAIEVPADAQWLTLPLQDDLKLLLGGAGTQLL